MIHHFSKVRAWTKIKWKTNCSSTQRTTYNDQLTINNIIFKQLHPQQNKKEENTSARCALNVQEEHKTQHTKMIAR